MDDGTVGNLKHEMCQGLFTPSEIERDQRTSEKDQRINDKGILRFYVRFRSVWTQLKKSAFPDLF